ncbi:hypothetical protein BDD12DRAFT_18812 [Trichophaea hybrida]|nr:hypothetical protein BDD12DRAFT_18812 [Trichophaea hybrida]
MEGYWWLTHSPRRYISSATNYYSAADNLPVTSRMGRPVNPQLVGQLVGRHATSPSVQSTTFNSLPIHDPSNRLHGQPFRASAETSIVMHERGWTQCKECGKSVRALRRHIRDVHRKKDLEDCPMDGCPRKGSNGFGRVDNLRDHLRRVHEIAIPKMYRRKKRVDD